MGVETQFKPGQSGNPKGKKKGTLSLTAQLKKALNGKITLSDGTKISAADAVVKKALMGALQGDTQLIKLFFDRIDGPVASLNELTGKDGADLFPKTITIEVLHREHPDR